MTAKEFIAWASGYYGQYPEGQRKDIGAYLIQREGQYLDALKKVLLRNYSSKWGHTPDIAIFESMADEARKETQQTFVALEEPAPCGFEDQIAEAEKRGINPAVRGWLYRLLTVNVREKKESV